MPRACSGADPPPTVRQVQLPLAWPAVLSGALLVFVDCVKELPATLLLRPLNVETLATHLYGEAARGTYEDGTVAALLIVLVGPDAGGGAAAPRREARPLRRVERPSTLDGPALPALEGATVRVRSSAGEHSLHTRRVTGSIPVAPTIPSSRRLIEGHEGVDRTDQIIEMRDHAIGPECVDGRIRVAEGHRR